MWTRHWGACVTRKNPSTNISPLKTPNGYSFNWVKYDIDGVAQDEAAKATIESEWNDDSWNASTRMFAMTLTTSADGTWSDNNDPVSSGTYTVDEANSKVTIETLIKKGNTLLDPDIMEATYSNNVKTLVVVQDDSYDEVRHTNTMTFTRK